MGKIADFEQTMFMNVLGGNEMSDVNLLGLSSNYTSNLSSITVHHYYMYGYVKIVLCYMYLQEKFLNSRIPLLTSVRDVIFYIQLKHYGLKVFVSIPFEVSHYPDHFSLCRGL
jgi:hypothetical protein